MKQIIMVVLMWVVIGVAFAHEPEQSMPADQACPMMVKDKAGKDIVAGQGCCSHHQGVS